MPPNLNDVKHTAMEFAEILGKLQEAPGEELPIYDEALTCGKRLYRMLRHIPGIHNHGDAPERQS